MGMEMRKGKRDGWWYLTFPALQVGNCLPIGPMLVGAGAIGCRAAGTCLGKASSGGKDDDFDHKTGRQLSRILFWIGALRAAERASCSVNIADILEIIS
jgi:hypothetical protein